MTAFDVKLTKWFQVRARAGWWISLIVKHDDHQFPQSNTILNNVYVIIELNFELNQPLESGEKSQIIQYVWQRHSSQMAWSAASPVILGYY